eukprot:g71194.t1
MRSTHCSSGDRKLVQLHVHIPKSGGSTIEFNLITIPGTGHESLQQAQKRIEAYQADQKVTWVPVFITELRDPPSRILSAFLDARSYTVSTSGRTSFYTCNHF